MLINRVINKIKSLLNNRASAVFAKFGNPYLGNNEGMLPGCVAALDLCSDFVFCKDFDVFLHPVNDKWDVSQEADYPWHEDFIFHDKWSNKWHKLLSYKLCGESDVKVPWELGRGHLFPQMALGVFKKQISLKHFKKVLESFCLHNSPGYGVQWQCPMDVSIRLVNLILSQMILNSSDVENSADLDQLLSTLYQFHYNYITSNMEVARDGFTNNHYLSNLLAKAWFFAFVTQDLDAAEELLDEIESQVAKQYLSDGGNFEGSTSYHFLSTEIIILSLAAIMQLYRLKGITFAKKNLMSKIEQAIKFASYSTSKSWFPCRVGDDDSGMVVRPQDLSTKALDEKNRYIAKMRIQAFNRFLWLFNREERVDLISPLTGILLGLEKDTLAKVPFVNSYPVFGLYKYETANTELFLRHLHTMGCAGHGGHNHQDDMSIEIFYKGQPIVVDPGSYCYTSNCGKRNYYRSEENHNGVMVQGKTPYKFIPGQKGLFHLTLKTDVWSKFKRNDLFDAIKTNWLGIIVERRIYSERDIEIHDFAEVEEAQIRFHISPGLDVRLDEEKVIIGDLIMLEFKNSKNINILNYMYSDFYLNERSAKVIEVCFNNEVRTHIIEL